METCNKIVYDMLGFCVVSLFVKGKVTRNVVQEVEEKKASQSRGRSTSRSAKAASTPKEKPPTPKKAETPKKKATPQKRSATPKKTPPAKASAQTQKAGKGKQKKTPEKKSPPKPKSSPSPATKSSRSRRRGDDTEEDKDAEAEKTEAEAAEDVAEPEKDEEKMETQDEALEKEDDNVEQDQPDEEAQAAEAERSENDDKVIEKVDSTPVEAAPIPENKEDTEDEPMENDQAESDQKENESAESEQVEAVESEASTLNQADKVITIDDDTVSTTEKSQENVIDINEDSGEALVVGEEPPTVHDLEATGDGSGDKTAAAKATNDVEIISDEDDDKAVNGAEVPIANSMGEKRKIDEVVDGVDAEAKKARLEEQQNLENGEADDQVSKDYVVVEMSDVPNADSEDVLKSLPNVVNKTAVNSEQIGSVNPIFNRVFIPNPAFTSADTTKQFSLVSYNILADCHMTRGNYSFTAPQFLKPEYRLTNVIEETKYLDGDIVCMQEVDPDFYNSQLLPAMKG